MAAAKPEIVIFYTKFNIPADVTLLVYHLQRKFQRLYPHFLGPAFQRKCYQHCAIKPEVRNPTWRHQTGSTYISAPRLGRPQNVDLAFGILFLPNLGAEI